MLKPLHIILADFHPYMLKGIVAELESEKNLKVVVALQNLDEIEKRISAFSADVLIVDYWFREQSSLGAIRKLRLKFPSLKIIVYTQEERVSYIKEMLGFVNGYIMKSEPEGTLKKAIERVFIGKKAISEDIRENLDSENNINHTLSTQEHKIVSYRIDGMNPNTISEQLSISEKTVRKHIDNARKKLGFGTTEDMIRWFWKQN